MSENKRYYYLKLKDNFFDIEEIKILESLPNGIYYSNLLIKLYLKSLKFNGALRFNDFIPYDENMIATITNLNIDIVRSGLRILSSMKLIEKLDDGTIYIMNIQSFIGKSSSEADRKKLYREQIEEEKQLLGQKKGRRKASVKSSLQQGEEPEGTDGTGRLEESEEVITEKNIDGITEGQRSLNCPDISLTNQGTILDKPSVEIEIRQGQMSSDCPDICPPNIGTFLGKRPPEIEIRDRDKELENRERDRDRNKDKELEDRKIDKDIENKHKSRENKQQVKSNKDPYHQQKHIKIQELQENQFNKVQHLQGNQQHIKVQKSQRKQQYKETEELKQHKLKETKEFENQQEFKKHDEIIEKQELQSQSVSLLKYFEEITGLIGGLNLAAVKLAISKHGAENVKKAMNKAFEKNKPTMIYINGILKNWAKEGYPEGGEGRKNGSSITIKGAATGEFLGFKPKEPRKLTEEELKEISSCLI